MTPLKALKDCSGDALRVIILGKPPKLPNRFGRTWLSRHGERKRWERMVNHALNDFRYWDDPLTKAKLTLVRYSSRQPDEDNLMASWKPVIDALVSYGVIEDDNPKVIVELVSKWRKCKRNEVRIEIVIESLEDQPPQQ